MTDSIQHFIDALVQSTGASSPEQAIRIKARELLALYQRSFGDPDIPIDVMALASLIGIRPSDSAPVLSPDAEIAPDGQGGVEMRVNPDRPETRKRFSIAHEISHTFFPDFQQKSWCRTDARFRDRNDPSQFLEMLCDIGASELLFPQPWFSSHAAGIETAKDLVELAHQYHASREATLRRYVELSSAPIAAVFFSWKLKPTQHGVIGNEAQGNLFGVSAQQELQDAMQLRIDYAIYSESLKALGYYFPSDKSIDRSESTVREAVLGACADSPSTYIDLGPCSGNYSVNAIPLPTARSESGPENQCNIALVLKPLSPKPRIQKKSRKSAADAPSLFD